MTTAFPCVNAVSSVGHPDVSRSPFPFLPSASGPAAAAAAAAAAAPATAAAATAASSLQVGLSQDPVVHVAGPEAEKPLSHENTYVPPLAMLVPPETALDTEKSLEHESALQVGPLHHAPATHVAGPEAEKPLSHENVNDTPLAVPSPPATLLAVVKSLVHGSDTKTSARRAGQPTQV